MLRKESFICDTTDLGEDGLEIGKLYDYDIIILDLLLPDMDGVPSQSRPLTAATFLRTTPASRFYPAGDETMPRSSENP